MKVKSEYVLKTVGDQFIVVPIGQEAVKFHGMLTLNETGKFLFENLKEEISLEDLTKKLVDEYDVSAEVAAADVLKFVNILKERNIME
ncbi:PqqD family protein [Acholeplasma equirhinis]|uniref:PqqD family protein n=1 Tax=Acholeplasma equirhinis TaxID=555393 RepID=UPI00197AC9CE|nr:PqqD family protein [Acholeplasma equirhinis]MBN3490890.1 PqqD family protein [Acholeplasma equirhinis]